MLVRKADIAQTYALLRVLRPFHRWALPTAGEIRFGLLAESDFGEYWIDVKDRRWISVNPHKHVTLADLTATVAHEMIHMRQDMLGRLGDTHEAQHNAEFRRLSHLVCRELGIQIGNF